MEGGQKKPKTIQMRYPAQYSQSWNENERPSRTTKAAKNKSKAQNAKKSHSPQSNSWANEKASKVKRRTSPRPGTQIVYPLPFTKAPQKSRNRKANPAPRRPTPRSTEPSMAACCHARPRMRGPDPTAPHLKYGLFPPKRSSNNDQVQVVSAAGQKSGGSAVDSSIKRDLKDIIMENEAGSTLSSRARRLRLTTPAHIDIRPTQRRLA